MVNGDMVTFKTAPTVNTPGSTPDAIAIGTEFTGVVVAEKIEKDFLGLSLIHI